MVKEPMSVDVKQVIQELIVPELREMKAEMKGLQIEIKRLDEKIDAQGIKLDNRIEALGARLDEKIDAQGTKLDNRIEALGARLDEKIDAQGTKLDNRIEALGARLDEKIDAQGARLDDKISSLRNEMLSLRNEILSEFRRLDERVDLTVHFRERLMSLETRMAAYENRN